MRVSIVRPGDPPGERVDICIVIDVLRATSTATVLCRRLGELCVVTTPADLGELPERAAGYALFSELAGVESDIPRFDNSPIQARDVELDGRMPVLVTTNGTLAISLAAQIADEVLLAGFINVAAILDHVHRRGVASVALMPAGNVKRVRRNAEDDACADVIVAMLAPDPAAPIDTAAAIAACRLDARIMERRANEPNLGADIDLCFDLDAVPIVPRVVGRADARWFRVVDAARA
ncbi:MAG: 2-phosphosulfolactate phosphatase [Myxococcales bacterium]|nr:2-phosphosulfolactate phosphatase [Myxococcales bacterium]